MNTAKLDQIIKKIDAKIPELVQITKQNAKKIDNFKNKVQNANSKADANAKIIAMLENNKARGKDF